MYDGMIHGGWMWFMIIVSVVLVLLLMVALVLTAVWLYQQVRGAGPGGVGPGGDPLAILKRRYARGEISDEEYRRMKQELSGSPEPGAGPER